jgi:uncharacterized Ntn-hydrolase superfamily protein
MEEKLLKEILVKLEALDSKIGDKGGREVREIFRELRQNLRDWKHHMNLRIDHLEENISDLRQLLLDKIIADSSRSIK